MTTIRTLFLQPLGPALILTLGGLLLWLVSWLGWRYARSRRMTPFFGFRLPFACLTVAVAAWLWLRVAATPAAQQLSWRWQPLTVAGAPIHWRIDAWSGIVGLLILLLTAVAVLRVWDGDGDASGLPAAPATERALWLAAAATVFVCSANLLTVASSWLLLDALVLAQLYPGRQVEPARRTAGLLAMVTPLLLLVLAMIGEAGLPASLMGGRFGRQELTLLWLLGLIRAGVYPFHFWLTDRDPVGVGAQTVVSLVGPVAGIWFLARIQELAGAGLTRRPEWAALGVLALLGSALAAWLAESPTRRWRWIAINRASVTLLAAYASGIAGPATFVWPLAAFGLGSALLAIGQGGAAGGRLRRWPALLAALILWGAPGTIGFLARSALIFPTELPLAAPLFATVLVSEALLAAALWESVRSAAGADRVRVGALARIGLATVLLAAPTLAWGLFPQRLAAWGDFPLPDSALSLGQLIGGARRSVWIGLIVSGVLGAALGVWRRHILGQMRGWQQLIGEIVTLEWLYRVVTAGLRLAGSGLQYFATLGEGEGYLGWLALAGLILWVLIRG